MFEKVKSVSTKILLVIGWIIFSLKSHAQDLNFVHYTTENGLISNSLYKIKQDKQGYIWVCSPDGISKFDGSKFKNYNITQGLTDNDVLDLYVSPSNRIWCIIYNTKPCYFENEKFHSTQYGNKVKQALLDTYVGAIEYTGVGKKYLATSKNNFLMIDDSIISDISNQIEIKGTNSFAKKLFYTGITTLSADKYLINGGQSILLYQNKSIQPIISVENGLPKNAQINYIFKHNKIYVWGIFHRKHNSFFQIYDWIKEGKATLLKTHSIDFPVISFCVDNDSSVWLGERNNGLQHFKNPIANDNSENYLAGKTINGILLDRENNLWFASSDDGFFMLQFRKSFSYNTNVGLKDNNVRTIAIDAQNNIWAGLKSSMLDIISPSTNAIKHFDFSNEIYGTNNITEISINPKKKSAFIVNQNGILELFENKKVLHVMANPSTVKCFCKINENKVVAGLFNSAVEFSFDGIKWIQKDIWNKRATAVCSDTNANIWLGSLSGLYCRQANGEIEKINHNNIAAFDDRITYLTTSKKTNIVAVATSKSGVLLFANKQWFLFNAANGLVNESCKKIVEDDEHNFWVITTTSIFKISITYDGGIKMKLLDYTNSKGVEAKEVNDIWVQNKKMYLSTHQGLIFFNEQNSRTILPPLINLESFVAKNAIYNFDSAIILKHNDNSIEIHFVGISFKSLKKIRYKYLLSGINNEWKTTTSNMIQYASLPPGDYTFKVFAVADNNTISTTPASISFKIEPAKWQRWYFKLLVVIFCTALLFLIYYLNIIRIKQREKTKSAFNKRIAELEMQALRLQMNPPFIFNCLNSIQHLIINNNNKEAEKYLHEFAALVRKTIHQSKSNFIDLNDEIDFLKNYLQMEQMRFENSFEFDILIDENLKLADIEIPTMLMQPIVENAVQHGLRYLKNEKGILKIEFKLQENKLICTIDDNGIGINQSYKLKTEHQKKHESISLKVLQERIETFKKMKGKEITCSIIDKIEMEQSSKGTLVILNFYQ